MKKPFKNYINNIESVSSNNLCTGCGVCEDICPKHCINIKRKNEIYVPQIDSTECLGEKCSRCLKVCPGEGIKLIKMAKDLYDSQTAKNDKYIGRHISLYTGYSLDENIRYHSASGGMVSQFLIYLLDKKIIDGAVVTGFSPKDHITPVSYIARNREDVLKARSSKYCPVALNKVGNEIKNSEGKFVIVGLPCHIQGFRKRAAIDKKFRENVLGYFSIYCSSNRTFYAQDFLLRKYKIKKEDIISFAYRDNGCLGNLTVEHRLREGEFPLFTTRNSSECRESKLSISIPFIHYYGALRSFFKPRRCLTCIDHYGALADVSFGDIHIKPYSEDQIGISSWIVRNSFFDELFKQAQEEGYITMNELDTHTLNESQKAMLYPKERRAQALININKWCGKKTVTYDKVLDRPSLKDYISEIICLFQQFIGNHKSLWWIIDFFYDKSIKTITRKS